MADCKAAKNMAGLNAPNIYLMQKIFVPMITNKLTLEEANVYENPMLKPGN